MVKVRQDAWSHEDDLLLAETVLRHIREGSTQLNAFEEVGDQLNRTSAACGFRWNAEIRNKYNDAIDLAKRQRKEKKRAMQGNKPKRQSPALAMPTEKPATIPAQPFQHESLTIDGVIQFLSSMKQQFYASDQSEQTLHRVQQENKNLRDKIASLENKLSKTEEQLNTVQEDYQVFLQIMDRARKMTVLDDQGSLKAPTFRMDKNGNLEQMIQGMNG